MAVLGFTNLPDADKPKKLDNCCQKRGSLADARLSLREKMRDIIPIYIDRALIMQFYLNILYFFYTFCNNSMHLVLFYTMIFGYIILCHFQKIVLCEHGGLLPVKLID
jgi:hypothetical protein